MVTKLVPSAAIAAFANGVFFTPDVTSTVRLSNTNVSNNSVMGMYNDGSGLVVSYGNNRFANNPADGVFTSTIAQK